MSYFNEIFNSSINKNNDSERFQEGLFTGFYAMEQAGITRENIFKIFEVWENNNPLQNEDYKNLKENYLEFVKQYNSVYETLKDIKGE